MLAVSIKFDIAVGVHLIEIIECMAVARIAAPFALRITLRCKPRTDLGIIGAIPIGCHNSNPVQRKKEKDQHPSNHGADPYQCRAH